MTNGSRTSTGPCACTRRPRTGSERLPSRSRGRAPEPDAEGRPRPFWRSASRARSRAGRLLAVAVAGFSPRAIPAAGSTWCSPTMWGSSTRRQRDRRRDPGRYPPGADRRRRRLGLGRQCPDRTLTRSIRRRVRPTATIPLENRTPTGIAVGLGSVWVAHGLRGQVSQSRSPVRSGDAARSPSRAPPSDRLTAALRWTRARPGSRSATRPSPADPAGRILGPDAGRNPARRHRRRRGIRLGGELRRRHCPAFNPETFLEGPIRTFNVGAAPTGIAYAGGAIWVANSGDDASPASIPTRAQRFRSPSETGRPRSPAGAVRSGSPTLLPGRSLGSIRPRTRSSRRSRSATLRPASSSSTASSGSTAQAAVSYREADRGEVDHRPQDHAAHALRDQCRLVQEVDRGDGSGLAGQPDVDAAYALLRRCPAACERLAHLPILRAEREAGEVRARRRTAGRRAG